jgi:hypothetical protein
MLKYAKNTTLGINSFFYVIYINQEKSVISIINDVFRVVLPDGIPDQYRLYRIDYAAAAGKCQLIKQRNLNRSKFLNP